MRYLGGKSRLAKPIAEIVNSVRPEGARVWEPFMGGGAVTVALAKDGPVDASDVHEGLITMWKAALDGWVPDPREATEERYHTCRIAKDMSDPWTAFMGFGCSYGGKWFGGYMGWVRGRCNSKSYETWQCFPLTQARTLDMQVHALRTSGSVVSHFDFLAQTRDDWPAGWPIYCDPPYRGTTGYKGTASFDHALFWQRVGGYAHRGCPVFVSEFSEPPAREGCTVECVWEKKRKNQMNREDVVDRLFLVKRA